MIWQVNAALQRLVWQKARNRCENCHYVYALEIDHRIPRAHGGANTPHNLCLLCCEHAPSPSAQRELQLRCLAYDFWWEVLAKYFFVSTFAASTPG
ncbi:MAG: HNH endonuclease [Bdellovibrionales bacterium]|nr:HNH endonuclease [Bdellovibrionales bacterium]